MAGIEKTGMTGMTEVTEEIVVTGATVVTEEMAIALMAVAEEEAVGETGEETEIEVTEEAKTLGYCLLILGEAKRLRTAKD